MKNILTILLLLGSFAAACAAEPATPAQRLAALGITLPVPPASVANYVPAVRSGNLVFLAGQVARAPDGRVITGKVGRDFNEAEGIGAARICALQLLAALQAEVGDLNKVKRIVRVGGFVNCPDNFTAQSKIVNGASDLLVAVFGDAGKHARAAIGVASLPGGAPVEIELIAEVVD